LEGKDALLKLFAIAVLQIAKNSTVCDYMGLIKPKISDQSKGCGPLNRGSVFKPFVLTSMA